MNKFLSCDWGTTSFRLRLVEVEPFKVLAEESSLQGIAGTFKKFQEQENNKPAGRFDFYVKVIQEHIEKLEQKVNYALAGIPVVISGMASSTIGIVNLPYQLLPFSTDGFDIKTHYFEATEHFNHEVILISGVRSEDDVMRGEETQLIGCIPNEPEANLNQLFIFPGTHSKHILVRGQQVISFKTFMTGEFFELLSRKSILHASVAENDELPLGGALNSFELGVKDAVGTNLLNGAFRVRTNDLFNRWNRKENYHYLSGLLIGTELQEIQQADIPDIFLFCGNNLLKYYERALAGLNLTIHVKTFPAQWVEEAVIRGQMKILNHNHKSA
jgi:2-dehydro-3-deoxygalactonokinase